jgi:hypothetical protein
MGAGEVATKKVDPSGDRPLEALERSLEGHVYRSLLGGLRGHYAVETDVRPPVAELKRAVTRRFQSDRPGRAPAGEIRLTDWFGGWTPEGRGIFEAEVERQASGRWRHVGRVRVVVRTSNRAHRWVAVAAA